MDAHVLSEDGRSTRQPRVLCMATMVPAFALLIPSGVLTYQPLPAIGLVPMAMSAALGASTFMMTKKISAYRQMFADFVVAVSLLAVLVPR